MSRLLPKVPWGVRRLFQLPRSHDRMLRELEDELRAHTEMRVEYLRTLGMTEPEARAEAARRFGDEGEFRRYAERRVTRRSRRLRLGQWVGECAQDGRFAMRQLAKAPGLATVAVLTLALGIGANTAIFSVAHRLLLSPLPYPNGDRIVVPMQQDPDGPSAVAPAVIEAWRESARTVDLIAGAMPAGMFDVSGDGTVVPNPNAWMTANYLDLLGVKPVVGRSFGPDDEAVELPSVAMIGYGLWQREYAGAESVVGASIRINGRPVTIVGVVPPGVTIPLTSPDVPDIWLPRRITSGSVFARLREGVSAAAATRELEAVASGLPAAARERTPIRVMRMQEFLEPRHVRSVQLLFVAVGVLLLIACANVANLLLARAWMRQREFAVRTALGAGRLRLARQVLTESILLALAGAVAGLGIAGITLRVILAMRPPELTDLANVGLEPVALYWTLGISVVTGLLFGCAPALVASTRKFGDVLKRETGGATVTRVSHRVRSSLIVLEVALSVVLLVSATLLAGSVANLQRVRLGFEPRGLVEARTIIGGAWNSGRHAALRERFLERTRSLAGVSGVAMGPMPGSGGPSGDVETPPDASGRVTRTGSVLTHQISPAYFRVAGIDLITGRLPDAGRSSGSAAGQRGWQPSAEVVVSRALAERLWPDGGAVGSRVRPIAGGPRNEPLPWSTVVGIVADVRAPGQRDAMGAMALYSLVPPTFPMTSFLVRTSAPGVASSPALERAVKALDPNLFVYRLRDGETYLHDGLAASRFAMTLLMAFAGIAVTLAAVGLYGVVAYAVTQRTREIGIRVALGASPVAVARLVVGGGVTLAVGGVVTGVVASGATTRLIASLLYDVRPTDPLAFGAAAGLVAFVAVFASYVPARRALRIDPIEALRAE